MNLDKELKYKLTELKTKLQEVEKITKEIDKHNESFIENLELLDIEAEMMLLRTKVQVQIERLNKIIIR